MVVIDSLDLNEKLPKLAELLDGYSVFGGIIKETEFVSFTVYFEPRPEDYIVERMAELTKRFNDLDCTLNYISKSDSYYGIECLVS
ncbi:MAG: hypothetical protein KAS12_02030 [Candidatus Aenigmarchaeota archaeon]|nr:hypothetical protein [Candidatus Aenigmarchaeota archaeon]